LRGSDGAPTERQAAADWLGGMQHANGGWDWGDGLEVPETDSECLFALTLVPPSSQLNAQIPSEHLIKRPNVARPFSLGD